MAVAPNTTAPKRPRFPLSTIAAIAVALVGVALIVVSGAYIFSRTRSGSDADEFVYTVSDEQLGSHLGRVASTTPFTPVQGRDAVPLELKSPDVARFAGLYPGNLLNPKYWSEPEWAGSDAFGGPSIPDGFIPVLSTDLFRGFDPAAEATGMRIPAIGVDSTVAELEILDLGDQREYQTPDNTVGHIPQTASPGQQGSGWFFAHLESFVAGEGSIFRRLPEVTELMKQDPVDVYVMTADVEFIYRVTGTSQIPEEDLKLSDADDAQITLVTCWPSRVYDQRVLVDATLIAYRPL